MIRNFQKTRMFSKHREYYQNLLKPFYIHKDKNVNNSRILVHFMFVGSFRIYKFSEKNVFIVVPRCFGLWEIQISTLFF